MLALVHEAAPNLSMFLPATQEFYLMCFFCLGFALFRVDVVQRQLRIVLPGPTQVQTYTATTLQVESEAGRHEEVLKCWAHLRESSSVTLGQVARSLVFLGRAEEVPLLFEKTLAKQPELRSSLHEALGVLDTTNTEHGRFLEDMLQHANVLQPTDRFYEELAVAFARQNNEQRVSQCLACLSHRKEPQHKTFSAIARGFLDVGNVGIAVSYTKQLVRSGAEVDQLAALTAARCLASGDEVAAQALASCLRSAGRASSSDVVLPLLQLAEASKNLKLVRELTALLVASPPRDPRLLDVALRAHLCSLHAGLELPVGGMESLATLTDTFPRCFCTGSTLALAVSVSTDMGSAALSRLLMSHIAANLTQACVLFPDAVSALALEEKWVCICRLFDVLVPGICRSHGSGALEQVCFAALQAGRTDIVQRFTGQPLSRGIQQLIASCTSTECEQALKCLQAVTPKAAIATWNATLQVCVLHAESNVVSELFQLMKRSSRVDAMSYNIMLKHVLRGVVDGKAAQTTADTWRRAVAVLEEMRFLNLQPTTATFNSLLDAAVRAGEMGKMWRTLDLMQRSGREMDGVTLSTLFKGLRSRPDGLSRGLKLLQRWCGQNQVDGILVGAVLEACTRAHDRTYIEGALKAFEKAGYDKSTFQAHTYAVLIKAHGRCGQLVCAREWWRETVHRNDKFLTPQVYGCMLDVLVSASLMEEALQLFEEMKRVCKDSARTDGFVMAYAMIIRGHGQRREIAQAVALYIELKALQAPVSRVIFNTLIDACVEVCDMATSLRLYSEMASSDGCSPDLITYTTLIKGHSAQLEMDQALQLFAVMRQRGIQPDAVVFHVVLEGCARCGAPHLALQVLNDMEQAGIEPSNHSLSLLVKALSRGGDLEAARQIVEDLPARFGFRPNTAVYTCLMAALINGDRLDCAMSLLEQMRADRALPDERTYSTLLRGAVRKASIVDCLSLLELALAQGSPAALIRADLARSVLALCRRCHVWGSHGLSLSSRLRAAGVLHGAHRVRVRGRVSPCGSRRGVLESAH